MCLALPAEIVSIDAAQQTARVSISGVVKEVSLALVEDVKVGEFVLIHVGFALNKIDAEEAKRTLDIMTEAGLVEESLL